VGKLLFRKLILLAFVCVLSSYATQAAEVASLYTVEVPLDASRPDARAHAYETALAQVVLRLSGAELVNDVVLFDAVFPDPSAYVVQFRPGPDETLVVTFDGDAVEKTLRDAGQPVWGGDRPLTLVWIAVDWGQGDREILGAADEEAGTDGERTINPDRLLRERVLDSAQRRGVPVAFPLLDSEDLASVSFSDVWGGFDERVLAASERYDVSSVLIGRVRASSQGQDRWTYYFSDEQRSLTGEPERVIGVVAEVLAAEFAIGGDEPLRTVEVNVSGVTTVEAFGELNSLLSGISAIDRFAITEVAGDRITYSVTAHGGADRLARMLRFEGLLEQDRIDMSEFGIAETRTSLDFSYAP
jgi:hypothetical protein